MKINPNGFREYDARWIFEKEIDIEGISNLGKGLGTQIIKHTNKNNPRVIVGHDYRSYSEKIKKALTEGLVSTGCNIEDVGLALSPMVYFAQFNLNSDAIAMVTASHNENGWTGVKMGIKKGLTHAPKEMSELKDITLNNKFKSGKGDLKKIDNFKKIYIQDLIKNNKINKKIKAVVACGNGTAGVFAPQILKGIGCEVIELDCELDWSFPKYNPNPEDLEMLHAISKAVKDNKADIGFGFDGDGDRCGVIDEKGKEIDGDQLIALIAKNLKMEKTLQGNTVVSTIMSNLGLQKYLNNLGLDLFRTPVGDRYVAEIMNKKGFNFGGEKSGHIIMTDYSSTGDGLLAALHFLSILKESKKTTSELLNVFEPFPQKLVNLKFEPENDPLENLEFKKTIEKLSIKIANNGEILVRKSGTEPVIRIMIQHSNSKMIAPILKEIENKISNS